VTSYRRSFSSSSAVYRYMYSPKSNRYAHQQCRPRTSPKNHSQDSGDKTNDVQSGEQHCSSMCKNL